jgi:hypothetical protein
MNKDNIIGFLVELNEMLESEKFKLPTDIYDETNKCIKRSTIVDWKSRVDEATADLSIRWLQEEVNLESSIKQWSSTFYDEYEFTEAIGKIAKIVEYWKKTLTEILYKDPSVYTMPKENADNEDVMENENDSLQEDSESSQSEILEERKEESEEKGKEKEKIDVIDEVEENEVVE